MEGRVFKIWVVYHFLFWMIVLVYVYTHVCVYVCICIYAHLCIISTSGDIGSE